MMKRIISIAFVLAFPIWSILVFGQSEDLLTTSESLMTQGDFYEALVVLQPLLTANQKSYSQEQALWRANALCETLVRDGILTREFEKVHKIGHTDRRRDEDYLKWEKIVTLNKWGAHIGFNHLGGIYDYHYGFLKRLVELYPDSKRRSAAEYYLIQRRYNDLEVVEKWLNELYSYVSKNADSGLGELYMAYLDIAHINDNLWQLLTYPDGIYNVPFSSGDPALDKERAARYKAEALKYYAKVIISGYGGRFVHFSQRSDIINRFQELKQDKKTNRFWILYD